MTPTMHLRKNVKIPIRLLALSASPMKGGRTDKLLARFVVAARRQGAAVEVIRLTDARIPLFDGVLHHRHASNVAQKLPRTLPILNKLKDCDGFVIATPTWWFNVPGHLKNFLDHLTVLEEYGYYLEGKVAGFIAFSPHGGGTGVVENLANVFSSMGCVLPPYSMIWFGQKEEQWSLRDIPLLAKNIIAQIRAQKNLGISWDYERN